MSQQTLWLRDEVKPHERRTPLVPEHAAELISDGHQIVVEYSNDRIFCDDEYVAAGCTMVDAGSWVDAPLDAYILGIKELPESDTPLKHRHIYFAHAFKGQDGAQQLLERFKQGNGLLYDLEFLQDVSTKQRVTYFSYWAGVAGAAVSLLLWVQKCLDASQTFTIPEFFKNEAVLIDTLQQQLSQVGKPDSLVIGASGRCGRGAMDFLNKLQLPTTGWDKQDTQDVTNYSKIFQYQILFNCIYLTKKIPPFITREQLAAKGKLSIVADISCDPNGPNNPLPIYDSITTFEHPVVRVGDAPNTLDIMAIDHLPSFLPRESSGDFSTQLLPYLKQLLTSGMASPTWQLAKNYYDEATITKSLG